MSEHFMKLTNNNTENACAKYMRDIKRPRSRPQETWVAVMQKDLHIIYKLIGLLWEKAIEAIELTKNKKNKSRQHWISASNNSVS